MTVAKALGGGTPIGLASLRRLDAVTRAIERITRGDLSRRLPIGRSNDDIDRLGRVVNSMLDQIERLIGEVEGVCDSVAHDLRTPFTRLLAVLERAGRRSALRKERDEALEVAVAEVQLMLRTFAALLRISEFVLKPASSLDLMPKESSPRHRGRDTLGLRPRRSPRCPRLDKC